MVHFSVIRVKGSPSYDFDACGDILAMAKAVGGGCGRKVGRLGVRIGVRMFSIEDRRRAVDLYFTEGMTIRKVVAKLGYPSEGALAKWVREDPRCTVPLAFHKF